MTVQDVGQTQGIRKITCQDFIVGQTRNLGAAAVGGAAVGAAAGVAAQGGAGRIVTQQHSAAQAQAQASASAAARQVPKGEEKGKTVFEEVGDWLFNKFDEMKKSLIRILLAILLALLIFGLLDIFLLQITPFGKSIYSRLYPPDVVITTVPAGAVVSMKTKEGDVVLNNVSSTSPIPVRKVLPKTYIVTAIKEGFKPVQRVVQIEQSDKGKKVRKEKIEIMFDFLLNVDSEPRGASVYIDGNKFGVTPCKAQLLAGAHTVKLTLEGFDNLGYDSASGGKEGQCDIDFTKSIIEEMFSGVDRRFWNCELKNIEGENIFSVTGSLFKKVKIDSEPKGMMVHVQGESQPRGDTPLNTLFKVGNYKVRFLDPSAKYGEALKDFEVNKDSKTDLFVKMNKIVSFKVKSKDSPTDTFLTKVTISNKDMEIVKDISTSKPIRIPLPVAVYNVTFHGDSEYRPCKLTNVDINNTSSIVGELEYLKVALALKATDSKTANPLSGAYIWLDKKMIGKTDKSGIYNGSFKPGKYEFKVIAKGYKEQIVFVEVLSGKKSELQVIMEPEASEEEIVPINTNAYVPTQTDANSDISDEIAPTEDKITPKETSKPVATKKEKKKKKEEKLTTTDEDVTTENQVVVCLNCGYVNTAPAGKKLRFCVNCAKSLK